LPKSKLRWLCRWNNYHVVARSGAPKQPLNNNQIASAKNASQ
jgi:hypothetical protein